MRMPGEQFVRQRADGLREAAVTLALQTLADQADALEATYERWLDEELTPAEAAAERGWAEDTVRSYLRDGRLPQAGRKNSPRVRRRHLFEDAPAGLADPPPPDPDLTRREALAAQVVGAKAPDAQDLTGESGTPTGARR